MTSYFTSEHFKLMNKWKGQKYDASNPEQKRVYEELKRAYIVTEEWANRVREKLFPLGSRVEIRKRPTNQANNFFEYTWAKIYPRLDSPKELAYTVGIDSSIGFVIKIDTVGLDDTSPLRKTYLNLRNPPNDQSPFYAFLSVEEGLKKSLAELVDWSVSTIQNFKMNYETVAEKLGLIEQLDDLSILKHFDGKQEFKEFRETWSTETTVLFCRLARAVHSAGLDWWHANKQTQIQFGRKEPGNLRASGVLGILRGSRKWTITITLTQGIGHAPKMYRGLLREDVIAWIESPSESGGKALNDWMPITPVRSGYWPDELQEEPANPEDESEDSGNIEVPMSTSRAPFNRIYYGPPGTGKTYELQRLLDHDYTQKNPTLSETEWTEQKIAELIQDLTWWEVLATALYDLGGRAGVNELKAHPYVQALISRKKRTQNVAQTIWGSLQNHAPEDSKTVKAKNRIAPYIFDKTESSEWFFVGDWKEECSELLSKVDAIKKGPQGSSETIRRYEFVTFHQSFGYEEFVEGLRPVLDGESDELAYEIRWGAFLRLCDRARENPGHQYAMVIDEINRGNISKIFGELITLIEVDKREGAKYPVSVTLPYSGESFSVPANVDLIGTMNTADRSLALVDTALRRRFEFVEYMPNPGVLNGILVIKNGIEINIEQLLETLNRRIEALYDRDHTIGHAYFTPLLDTDSSAHFETFKAIFKNKIFPLLEEYFFEDWQKIRLVLGDNQKQKQYQFVQEISREEDLAALFGQEHELDQYAVRSRYQLNTENLNEPKSYLGIYAPTE
jgi:5-methylcytosine-specific restriction protein B